MRRRLAGTLRTLRFETFGLAFGALLALVAIRTPVARRSILALFAGNAFGGWSRCRCAVGRRCRLLRARRATRTIVRTPFAAGMTARTPDFDRLGFLGRFIRLRCVGGRNSNGAIASQRSRRFDSFGNRGLGGSVSGRSRD